MPLAAQNITFGYVPPPRGRNILQAVTAEFPAGSVTAILGPNGAGKSTLMRVLLGALRPQDGAATLDGENIAGIPGRRRAARIAYVPQRPLVSAPFSVVQVVRLGRFARTPDEPAVRRALKIMELEDIADDPFATLSAGQQQRVVVARALAQLSGTPEGAVRPVLLADEPCSAMDPRHELHTLQILRDQSAGGTTVLIILHDFTAAARFADYAVILSEEGRVAAAGPARATIRAEVLEPVFGVRFQELQDAGGGKAILAVAKSE